MYQLWNSTAVVPPLSVKLKIPSFFNTWKMSEIVQRMSCGPWGGLPTYQIRWPSLSCSSRALPRPTSTSPLSPTQVGENVVTLSIISITVIISTSPTSSSSLYSSLYLRAVLQRQRIVSPSIVWNHIMTNNRGPRLRPWAIRENDSSDEQQYD